MYSIFLGWNCQRWVWLVWCANFGYDGVLFIFIFFIRTRSNHCLPLSITHSLTHVVETLIMWPQCLKILSQYKFELWWCKRIWWAPSLWWYKISNGSMNFDYLNLYLYLYLLWFCLLCFNQCLKFYRTATGNTSS